mmetsp:Transcript_4819/g.11497  ORF Transcript_4819/g.11497 Transcript_4819/m.11497 type:complete len:143 (-) Transcript_4819:104-532(-)
MVDDGLLTTKQKHEDVEQEEQEESERAQPAAPKMQVFEVIVPEGVQPNEHFTATADNQRVLLACPPNIVAGQKVRFKIPVSSRPPKPPPPKTINIQIRFEPRKKDEVGFWMRDRMITLGSSLIFMLVLLHCYSSLSLNRCYC